MMTFTTRIVPLLLILSGCATTSLPDMSEVEVPSEVPFNGANVILVEVGGEPEAIRDRIVQALRAESYDIRQSTINESTIETEPKVIGTSTSGSVRYFLDVPETAGDPIRLYGRMIQVSVEDRTSFQQYQSHPVTPGGERLSLPWHAWTTMNDLANVLGNNNLYDRD